MSFNVSIIKGEKTKDDVNFVTVNFPSISNYYFTFSNNGTVFL